MLAFLLGTGRREGRLLLLPVIALALGAILAAPPASAQCASGVMTAELQTDGPYMGYYKYTLSFSWETPRGLSHIAMDSFFGDCPEAACAQTWLFGDIAGTATASAGCTFDFSGEFNCSGDPSIGYESPVLKWDALDAGGCETGNAGTAVVSFYTDIPPSVGQSPVVLLKNGRNVCEGTVSGVFPIACPVPTEPTTWGRIKSLMSRHS